MKVANLYYLLVSKRKKISRWKETTTYAIVSFRDWSYQWMAIRLLPGPGTTSRCICFCDKKSEKLPNSSKTTLESQIFTTPSGYGTRLRKSSIICLTQCKGKGSLRYWTSKRIRWRWSTAKRWISRRKSKRKWSFIRCSLTIRTENRSYAPICCWKMWEKSSFTLSWLGKIEFANIKKTNWNNFKNKEIIRSAIWKSKSPSWKKQSAN